MIRTLGEPHHKKTTKIFFNYFTSFFKTIIFSKFIITHTNSKVQKKKIKLRITQKLLKKIHFKFAKKKNLN